MTFNIWYEEDDIETLWLTFYILSGFILTKSGQNNVHHNQYMMLHTLYYLSNYIVLVEEWIIINQFYCKNINQHSNTLLACIIARDSQLLRE